MSYEPTSEQRAMEETARQFAAARFAPNAARWDAEEIFPVEELRAAAALGLAGICLQAGEALDDLNVHRYEEIDCWTERRDDEKAKGCRSLMGGVKYLQGKQRRFTLVVAFMRPGEKSLADEDLCGNHDKGWGHSQDADRGFRRGEQHSPGFEIIESQADKDDSCGGQCGSNPVDFYFPVAGNIFKLESLTGKPIQLLPQSWQIQAAS